MPYGDNFLPSSIDPTTGQPLPANFLRPYRGYGDILVSEFAGFSDYDALQTSLTRRYTQGAALRRLRTRYSDAKNVGGTTGTTNPTVNPFLDVRDRNYRDVGRRTTWRSTTRTTSRRISAGTTRSSRACSTTGRSRA